MRNRSLARVTVLAAFLAVLAASVGAEEPAATAGVADTVTAETPRRASGSFSLELASDRRASALSLFAAGVSSGGDGLVAASFPDVLLPNRPALVGLPHFTLGAGPSVRLDAGGKVAILSLGPWNRTWDDLDTWEKVGVVLQTAGGVIAAARFAEIVIHQLKK